MRQVLKSSCHHHREDAELCLQTLLPLWGLKKNKTGEHGEGYCYLSEINKVFDVWDVRTLCMQALDTSKGS